MTRKRKVPEVEQSNSSSEWKSSAPNPQKFPRKNKKEFTEDDFSKQYGYVGGGQADNYEVEAVLDEPEKKQSPFPTEIVTYLRGIDALRLSEGQLENQIFDRCIEECAGHEVTLLSFRDACLVVEHVFGSSSYGANKFLYALSRLKHKVLLDLMFAGCAARTIECLLFACAPISNNQLVEVLSKFVDLLCDNWTDALTTQSSAFLVRCLARLLNGLPAKPKPKGKFAAPAVIKPKFSSKSIQEELQKLFERLSDLAVDFNASGGLFDNVNGSFVVQDILEADGSNGGRKCTKFVVNALKSLNENQILTSWKGRECSRIWEQSLGWASQESLAELWDKVKSQFDDLVSHPSANFVLQKLFAAANEESLATSIFSVAAPSISSLLASNRNGVVTGLVKCSEKFPALQEITLKELRKHFNADKNSNKTHFLFNILTWNRYDGNKFDVNLCQVQGCVLLESLLRLSKVKTLAACIELITKQQLITMSKHKIAGHVVQAIIKSPTLSDDLKNKVIAAFEDHWVDLISDISGSHTFDAIWDSPLFTVNRRQDLLKKLVPVRNESKTWRFAMLKCEMMLFRKDRKAWVAKMKEKKNK